AYSRPRMLRKRPQVLGVDLNRSESSGALPCCAATNDSTHEPAAPQDFSPVFVGFGSRADITRSPSNVRFTPQSGQEQTCWHVRFVPIASDRAAAKATTRSPRRRAAGMLPRLLGRAPLPS